MTDDIFCRYRDREAQIFAGCFAGYLTGKPVKLFLSWSRCWSRESMPVTAVGYYWNGTVLSNKSFICLYLTDRYSDTWNTSDWGAVHE